MRTGHNKESFCEKSSLHREQDEASWEQQVTKDGFGFLYGHTGCRVTAQCFQDVVFQPRSLSSATHSGKKKKECRIETVLDMIFWVQKYICILSQEFLEAALHSKKAVKTAIIYILPLWQTLLSYISGFIRESQWPQLGMEVLSLPQCHLSRVIVLDRGLHT